MTIYAEKRRGKLTGRFVVEVTREGRRLRQICENIAEARDTECALRSGEALPKETEESGLTLGWLADHSGTIWQDCRDPSTARRLAIIADAGGRKTDLREIDTGWLMRLRDKLAAIPVGSGRSRPLKDGQTFNRYLSTISKALQWAHRYDPKACPAVPEMPWTRVKKKTSVFYTDDEERRVVDYFLTAENPHYAFLVLVLVSTGVRPSELWEMLPEQVRDGWLVIGREDRLTKTNSMRFVPIRPDLEEPLRFLLTKGLPKYGTFADALQRAREACGITAKKTPYKLRHTALTRLGSAGVSLATIQQLAGHSAIQTTIQYLHVEPHTVQEAANVLWNRGAMVGQLAISTPEDANGIPMSRASSIGAHNALKILRLERAVPVRSRPPAPSLLPPSAH